MLRRALLFGRNKSKQRPLCVRTTQRSLIPCLFLGITFVLTGLRKTDLDDGLTSFPGRGQVAVAQSAMTRTEIVQQTQLHQRLF